MNRRTILTWLASLPFVGLLPGLTQASKPSGKHYTLAFDLLPGERDPEGENRHYLTRLIVDSEWDEEAFQQRMKAGKYVAVQLPGVIRLGFNPLTTGTDIDGKDARSVYAFANRPLCFPDRAKLEEAFKIILAFGRVKVIEAEPFDNAIVVRESPTGAYLAGFDVHIIDKPKGIGNFVPVWTAKTKQDALKVPNLVTLNSLRSWLPSNYALELWLGNDCRLKDTVNHMYGEGL